MSGVKISNLPAAGAITGTELVAVVQGGVTKQSTVTATQTTVSGGTTGLTPATATAGAVTLAGTLAVANGGTNASTASITSFNNITGYSATGATGTTSTNLVFSDSPSLTGTVAIPTKVLVGGPTSAVYAGGLQVYGAATTAAPNILQKGYGTTNVGPSLLFVKTRGTTATATTAVQLNDTLGSIAFYGSDGSTNNAFGAITGFVDGAVSSSPSTIPTAISFTTGTTSGLARMVITSSGNIGMGTLAPSSSAALEVSSVTQGVRFPVMTTTQKNAIGSPVSGLVVFDTTLAKLCVYSGSAWQTITSV